MWRALFCRRLHRVTSYATPSLGTGKGGTQYQSSFSCPIYSRHVTTKPSAKQPPSASPFCALRPWGGLRTLLVNAPLEPGPLVKVNGEEARHGRAVLRLREGHLIRLADGQGRAAIATVVNVGQGRASLLCSVQESDLEVLPHLPSEQLEVVIAPPKRTGLDDIVRALTELGVGAVTALECDWLEGRISDSDRLTKISREALKQCRRGWLPQVGRVLDVKRICTEASSIQTLVAEVTGGIFYPEEPRDTRLLIGPEAGFSPQEKDDLEAAGVRSIRVARPILKVETAAVAASSIVLNAWDS